MAIALSGIKAAQLEARGEGEFHLAGSAIKFRTGPHEVRWNCRTPKDAAQQLRILRAAPKHLGV